MKKLNCKKLLSLYPITPVSNTINNNSLLMPEYSVAKMLSYGEYECGAQKNIDAYDLTENIEFKKNECVMLCDNDYELSLEGYINAVNILNKHETPIILSQKLYNVLHEKVTLKKSHILSDSWNEPEKCSVLKTIEVPIVSIMGLGENCDKFSTQLHLYDALKRNGLKTIAICSNPSGLLFGMKPLPQFLFETDLSFSNKIIKFNNMLFDLVGKERPDIIIIGYPGGIHPHNDISYNYFGEIPYILSNAAHPDICIMNTYFMHDLNGKFLQSINDLCEKKYDISVFAYIMSNQNRKFDYENMHFLYKNYDEEFCLNNMPNLKNIKNYLYQSNDVSSIQIVSTCIYNMLRNAIYTV